MRISLHACTQPRAAVAIGDTVAVAACRRCPVCTRMRACGCGWVGMVAFIEADS